MQRSRIVMVIGILCCLLLSACGPRLEPGADLSGKGP